MFKINFKIIFVIAISALTVSCNKTATGEILPEPVIEKTVKKSELEKEMDIKRSFCFRTESVSKGNSSQVDILELKLDIVGSSVSGIYNWLPKDKDTREGFINGSITDNVIKGKYQFTYKGKDQILPIIIKMNDDSVIISENKNNAEIAATIARTNCSL